MLNGAFYSLPYDLLNDFAPISPLATFPLVLFARKTMPAKDLNELIAWLKANPNKASAGSIGGPPLAACVFQKETGTQVASCRIVALPRPCRTWWPARLTFTLTTGNRRSRAREHKSLCGDKRHADGDSTRHPDLCRDGTAGPFLVRLVRSFRARGTPRDIIGKLNAAAVEALADPAVRSRFADLGIEVFPREQQTPEALGALVKADAEKWWPIIKEFGIKAE